MTEAGTQVFFNPFEPGFREDPYPFYRRILDEAPVHRSLIGGWVLARYNDVNAVLRDPRASTGSIMDPNQRKALLEASGMWDVWQESAVPEFMNNIVLLKDQPDHTRIRSLMSRIFTPRSIENLRPRIQQILDDLLADLDPTNIDLIGDIAFPLPALVICEMLGIPAEERGELKEWSAAAARLLDPIMDRGVFDAADAGLKGFHEYFTALVAERRAKPGPGLLGDLIAAEEDGRGLSDSELLTNLVFLFGAGHETTQNLIGNATWALLRNPGERDKLVADPSLIKGAVEEFLRYDPPVQVTGRSALEPIDVGGITIEEGERVILLLAAANRDAEQFPDPDRLDVARPDVHPLSFGGGIHFCLGAALARVEGQVVLGTLIERYPQFAQTGEPAWRENFTLRGLSKLPLSLTA
ncbi:MAG: cytochrome P450 [Actinobacteria bacterium]|nr:cytochrome P450 [Actinomycetota bacterium]